MHLHERHPSFFLVCVFGMCLTLFYGCQADSFGKVRQYLFENYVLETNPVFAAHDIHFSITFSDDRFAVITRAEVPEWPQSMADTAYVLCLEKIDADWEVIYDLTRTDVPAQAELEDIRATFPARFPRDLLPRYWQRALLE